MSKNFQLLWVSQFMSQIVVNSLNFLMIIKVFEETGSTIAASLVWIAFIIPAIIISPIASAFIDKKNKKGVLQITNLFQAIIISTYVLTNSNFPYLAYAVVFCYSVVNQFYIPTELSSIPRLIEKKYLERANSYFLLTYMASILLTYTLVSKSSEVLGLNFTLTILATLLVIAWLAVSLIPEQSLATMTRKINAQNIFTDIKEGVEFLIHKKQILFALVTIVLLQSSLAVISTNLPQISLALYSQKATDSWILTAPVALGALLAFFTFSKKTSNKKLAKLVSNNSIFGLTLSVISISAASYISSQYTKNILVTLFLSCVGYFFVSLMVNAQTTLQKYTPKQLLGRILGFSWFLTTITTVAPVIFSATITEIFGIKTLFVVFSAILILVSVFFQKNKKIYV